MNSTRQLHEVGQSLWLDYIRRDLITNGKLQKLIDEDGVSGITSNPSIFEKALAENTFYDQEIREIISAEPGISAGAVFERLEVHDLQMAADVLRPVYDRTNGSDGFVSIEVSPKLAFDASASIAEGHRLWNEVNRPNLMVKIPATPQGMEAIETLTSDGINVNVTLIFSVPQYECVAEAYLRGLKASANPANVCSVASFFVSRVDTVVDRALAETESPDTSALKGRIAVANAKIAYRRFRQIFLSANFNEYKEKGAHIQRPLWASTSTKNKEYSDVLYVQELIGPDTINSVPLATLEAFRDHGKAHVTIMTGLKEAEDALGALESCEISLNSIGQSLLTDGVEAFSKSFDKMMGQLELKCRAFAADKAA